MSNYIFAMIGEDNLHYIDGNNSENVIYDYVGDTLYP